MSVSRPAIDHGQEATATSSDRMRWQRLHVATYARELQAAGLRTLDDFRAAQGRFIKNHHGLRDVIELTLPSPHGPIALFLKRNLVPMRKQMFRGFKRYRLLTSAAGIEWRNMHRYEQSGVHVCVPVAYGSEYGLNGERFSFILTQAAAGTPVDELAASVHDLAVRRRIIDAVAAMVRRAHAARIGVPGLLGRHVFIDLDEDKQVRTTTLIDLDRLALPWIMGPRRARDLAQLHLSMSRLHLSRTERLRFVKTYAGNIDRRLLHRIDGKIRYLEKRRPNLAATYRGEPPPA